MLKQFIIIFILITTFLYGNNQNNFIEQNINIIQKDLVNKSINNIIINKRIHFLKNRIKTNFKLKNNFAIKRDNLELEQLSNQLVFNNSLIILKKYFKEYTTKDKILKVVKLYKNSLSNNKLVLYKDLYLKLSKLKVSDKISKNFILNYKEDLKTYNLYNNFYDYFINNFNKIFNKNSVIEYLNSFNIFTISNYIDNKYDFSLNYYLKHYTHLTLGRITILLILSIIFLIFYFILKKIIYYLLKNYINQKEELSDEIKKYIRHILRANINFLLVIFFIDNLINLIFYDIFNLNNFNKIINLFYIIYFIYFIYITIDILIISFSDKFFQKYPNIKKEMIAFILKSLKGLLLSITLLIILSKLGFDIKALLASLGVGGIAIALASKDTLSNLFASVSIMLDNSFSQGDWIVTDKYEGTVVEIRMRTTTLRTFDNALVTIPNFQLANTEIKNYNKRKIGRRIKLNIGITYDSNINDIKKAINEIKHYLYESSDIATEKTLIDNKKSSLLIKKEDQIGVKKNLLVFLDNYSESSIDILVYCFTKTVEWKKWLKVKEEVLFKLADILKNNNLEFAFPTITINNKRNQEFLKEVK